MRVFEFVIAIVAISFIFKLLHTRMTMKHEEKQRDRPADEELSRQLAGLEERITVLERIVTDRTSELHKQFQNLENE